jgi:ADP-sugar diphosphatase
MIARTAAFKYLNLSTKHQHLTSIIKPFTSRRVAMANFVLAGSIPKCTVHHPESLSKEQLLSFPPFKTWLSSIQHSLFTQQDPSHTFHEAPYQLRKIEVQAVDFFGKGRIGFLKFQTHVINDKGETLPGAVFMRGGSVGMLVTTL